MDTPQEATKERPQSSGRTDEIRQAAAKLFETAGYSSTTITDIAKAVGILPGSLYYHFPSKEDIALDIVADFEEQARQLTTALLSRLKTPGTLSARAHLSQAASAIIDLCSRHRAALRLTAFAAPTTATTATEQFDQAREAAAGSLARVWKRLTSDLVPQPEPGTQDVSLLRFAFSKLTFDAPLNTAGTTPPQQTFALQIAMLLDGIALDTPSDDDLERSEAMLAARDAVRGWGPIDEPTAPNSREHILAAARIEFARRGFGATTVRDLAEAAQVRMGTLYRRVSSKDELLDDILGSYDTQMDTAVRAALTTGNSTVESLDALLFVLITAKRRFRRETDIVKLANFGTNQGNSAFESYGASSESRLRLLESMLMRGTGDGSISPLGVPAETAPLIRYISWVPYQDFARASPERAHTFLRNSLLRGFLSPR